MSVRVLRLIEIEYPSQEAYELDRLHWGLPANGEQFFGKAIYRTSTILSHTIGAEDVHSV